MSNDKKSNSPRPRPWMEYKLHIVVFFLVIIAELIGTRKIYLTKNIIIVLMPLLYAMVLGLGLFLFKPFKFIQNHESKVAENLMILFMVPILAKLAISGGQCLNSLSFAPALVLQQFGHLGSILLALPLALLLGFKREAIGMTSSICREPDIGIIIDRYGFRSPETRGVLTVYVIGTIIGTVFISLITSLATALPLHPYALAMASGIGSASMNAAALSPLLSIYPSSISDDILAFSGLSNLLSFCFGVYIVVFIALPLTEKLYRFLEPKIGRTSSVTIKPESYKDETDMKNHDLEKEISKFSFKRLINWGFLLFIFSIFVATANYIGYGSSFVKSFVGMVILSVIAYISFVLERLSPHNIPALIWVSIIGIILALPMVPSSHYIVPFVKAIDLSAIVTVYLAYVGISIGRDWDQFKKLGWKGGIITIFVILGTFLGSAIIAHLTLAVTGMI